MPWRGREASHCKICGGHRDEVGPLSARYKCASCGKRREQENLHKLQAHRGPYFQAWRRAMFTECLDALAEAGLLRQEQKRLALADFNQRAEISAVRYDLSPSDPPRISIRKAASKPLPASVTERQRAVGREIRQHYRKARRNVAQGLFLALINMHMQRGVQRLEAEKRAAEYVRKQYPDFTPLRV